MSAFGGLSFGAPWVLGALVLLPAIWWLLRVTPPAPRRVVFPPFRLLLGLAAPQETPARTPLWLLALRLAVAALVVVALAEPTVGRQATAVGQGPLVLFVDNDWMAAHAWKDRDAAISDALASAARADRAVAIIPTATASAPLVTLLDAGEAERDARALVPQAFALPIACAPPRPSQMRISPPGPTSSGSATVSITATRKRRYEFSDMPAA